MNETNQYLFYSKIKTDIYIKCHSRLDSQSFSHAQFVQMSLKSKAVTK